MFTSLCRMRGLSVVQAAVLREISSIESRSRGSSTEEVVRTGDREASTTATDAAHTCPWLPHVTTAIPTNPSMAPGGGGESRGPRTAVRETDEE